MYTALTIAGSDSSGGAGRILGGQCRNCAHRIHAVCGHGLDICLDAGASAGITSSNC